MNSKALDSFTENKVVFQELIELVNNVSAGQKELMMRLLIVSLAAFWEAFHEDLCRETLSRNPNPNAVRALARFHNPISRNIKGLYNDALGIPDITTAWWGNAKRKTGKSPAEFCAIIDKMMDLRHDTAHGKWKGHVSASDCMDFLVTAVHLAVRTDEHVVSLYP
jgi:hypothetical protein